MVALTYYFRLFRSTLFQFPQRFHAPSQPSDLSRKVFLVTGGTYKSNMSQRFSYRQITSCSLVIAVSAGNAGIGLETVRELAKRDATVIIGSRRVEKSEAAVGALERDLGICTVRLSCPK